MVRIHHYPRRGDLQQCKSLFFFLCCSRLSFLIIDKVRKEKAGRKFFRWGIQDRLPFAFAGFLYNQDRYAEKHNFSQCYFCHVLKSLYFCTHIAPLCNLGTTKRCLLLFQSLLKAVFLKSIEERTKPRVIQRNQRTTLPLKWKKERFNSRLSIATCFRVLVSFNHARTN